MKKHLASIPSLLLCTALALSVNSARAEVLIINNGSTLIINGPTLDVNCLDVLVKNGGALKLQSGTLQEKDVLTVEPGGLFSKAGGTIVTCSGNALPEVTPGQIFSIAEDSPDTTPVGTVLATDTDTGTVFSNWAISDGNDDAIFTISPSNGEITVASNTNLDFETTSSYSLFITVSDGTDQSAAGEVVINISGVNESPTLAPVGNMGVNELAALTFSATAVDTDVPANVLSFSLVGAPAGSSMTEAGAFAWTPTETQGPGSYEFDIVVSDNGTPTLQDSETITVTVNEVNVAPVLTPIGNQTVDEQSLLTFTASASDTDLPQNDLTFTLDGAPASSSFNSNSGQFTWIPSYSDAGIYNVTMRVSDTTVEANESFTITVTDVNQSPEFTGTPTITGTPKEGNTLGLTDLGTFDGDSDTITLSYQWEVDGVDITGETLASFPVTRDEKGKTVTCTITAEDGRGGTATYTTAGALIYKFNWWIFHEAIISKQLRNK